MADYSQHGPGLESPFDDWVSYTPADTDITPRPRAVIAFGEGTLVMRSRNGVDITLTISATNNNVGVELPYRPLQVRAASTATDIYLLS